jgi:uncharacterized protein YjbJ (UPF0337 family)
MELRVNEDRLTGKATNLAGRAEETYGRASGDVKHELQGRARQAEGAAHELYGEVKEQAARAADGIGESLSRADDFLGEMIERRPYTAAAVALTIGFLIGRFGRRGE